MYPKQPFDFAGRTGTVSFDVSNDTQGTHAAWPEFWITDTPVPAPFNHFNSWLSLPKNGLGIRFAANGEIGSHGICPNGNNLDKRASPWIPQSLFATMHTKMSPRLAWHLRTLRVAQE